MANGKLRHGDPMDAGSRSGEPEAVANATVRVQITFELDLTPFGGGIVPMAKPPARLIDRAATLMVSGPDALTKPPKNPQPNGLYGQLLPPPEKK